MIFFFNDTATTEIYTLSLHDALPICSRQRRFGAPTRGTGPLRLALAGVDRKSTRLNSSHGYISYAVFCLKNKTIDGVRNRTLLLTCCHALLKRCSQLI